MKIKQNVLVIGIVIVIAVAFVLIKGFSNRAEKQYSRKSTVADTKSDRRGQQSERLPRLIDLGKGTCIPCKKMKPILDELKVEYEGKAIVKIIDLRYEPRAARKYGIRLIPTQIFYDADGNEVYRHEGFMDKQSIKQKFVEMGVFSMESILSNISDVINNSPGLAYLAVFVGGLISASSPCVLAIIPLVIGFVGGYSEGNKRKAITYSLVFAFGLSVTFTILGAIASLVGGLFGDVGKFWYYLAAAVAIIMGLYLVGIIKFKLPQPVTLKTKHKGIIGAFLLGLLFGAVSSPCATPVLAVILAFVATKAKIIYGTSLLFVYAVGHCALIVLAGVFTGFVESYAKSKGVSNFSALTKKISGVLIFLAGLYILYINV